MKRSQKFLLVAAVANLCASMSAFGSEITFSGPTTYTTDSALLQPGNLIDADGWLGHAVTVTPTGGSAIIFGNGSNGNTNGPSAIDVSTASGGGVGSGSQGFYSGLSTGNGNFDAVLNGGAYDGNPNVITLSGLKVGNNYSVQVFVNDTRGGPNARTVNLSNTDGTGTSGTATQGTPSYFIGTFTADATSEKFKENLLNGGGNVNAVVVRSDQPNPFNVRWNAPVAITTDGTASDVVHTGKVVEAQYANGGGAGTQTVNGVPFTEGLSAYSGYAGTTAQGLQGFTTNNPAYNTVLNGFAYDGGNPNLLTLTGLTAGTTYEIQLWAIDNRGCCGGRTVDFSDPYNSTSSVFALGDKVSTTGIFVANGSTEQIEVNGVGQAAMDLTAFSVQALPEPSSLALLGFGSLGLLGRRRRAPLAK